MILRGRVFPPYSRGLGTGDLRKYAESVKPQIKIREISRGTLYTALCQHFSLFYFPVGDNIACYCEHGDTANV